MSIQNNLKDQLQWLREEGSKDRYRGFTNYETPKGMVGSSASFSNLNDKRNNVKVFDFESIYSTLSGSKVSNDKRAQSSAIATLGALGNMDREVFFTNDVQETSRANTTVQMPLTGPSSHPVNRTNSAPDSGNRIVKNSIPSEYRSKTATVINTQLQSNMQIDISRNKNEELTASLKEELNDLNDRINKCFSTPNKMSSNTAEILESLKVRRNEIENRLHKLLEGESAPNNIIADEIPPSSGNDVSDNDLLEALRLAEEQQAAKSSGATHVQQRKGLVSNGMSGLSNSTSGCLSPLPQQQYPVAFSADRSVTMNGATYHKSLPSNISSRDNSNYPYDNYSNPTETFHQPSNNYNSSIYNSRQAPQVDYNLSVSNPFPASTYLQPVHSSTADVSCICGLPCVLLTSRKDDSIGQKFYTCPKSRTDEGNCRFFKWENPVEKNFTTSSGPIFDTTRQLSNKNHKTELFQRFGHLSYRFGQLECVEAALQGRDVFCLMPTGGGKSVVYQLPAWCCPGIAVVFSPLISLIQDQVEALNAIKIRAVMSSSGTNDDFMEAVRELNGYIADSRSILDAGNNAAMDNQNIKMLYITPEKFNQSNHMQKLLQRLSACGLLSRFVIDEAHCLSQWGHDFRPDYLALSKLRPLCPNVPIMCLTATANQDVVNDCIRIMQLQNPYRHSQSFNRENLHYFVKKKGKTLMEDIAKYVTKRKNQTGIIYCFSKKDTEEVCESLKRNIPDMKKQITFYHADVAPAVREDRQRQWSTGTIKVICATIAFGMGINKPDVRYVIHHSLPKSLTNYYQESGRAGRDGKKAECVLYFTFNDKLKLLQMIDKSFEERAKGPRSAETHRQSTDNVNKCAAFCSNETECRRVMLLTYFGESFPRERCNSTCDNCQQPKRDLQEVDMTHHAVALLQVVRKIIEKFGDARLTAVKLSKVYARSKDKECKVFEASVDDVLASKDLMLKIDTGKALIQEMVLQGYLAEKSSASFSGYSASYVIIGPNANELLYNNAVIKLTLNQGPKARIASDKSAKKGGRDKSIDLDGGDADRLFEESSDGEMFNVPSPPVRAVPSTKQPNVKATNKKAKKNVYTMIDDMDTAPTRSRPVISLDTDDDEEQYDSHAENRYQKGANLPPAPAVSVVSKPSDLRPVKKKFRSPDLSSGVYSPPIADQNQNLDDSTATYIFPATQQPSHNEFLTSPMYMDVDSQPRRSQKRANDEIYEVNANVSAANNPSVAVRDTSNASLRPPALLSVKQKRAFTTWMDAYKRRFLKYWQVFGTDTIPEIVKLVPLSVEDVVNISGMGEVKGRAYGEQIVATIYSFLEKNDLLHLFPHAQPPTISESMEWSDPIQHWEMKDNESRHKDQGEVDFNHNSSSSRRDTDSQQRHVDDFFSSQPQILEPHRDRNSINGSRQSAQNAWGAPTVQNPPDHHSQSAITAAQIIDKEEDDYHYSTDDEINASNFLI